MRANTELTLMNGEKVRVLDTIEEMALALGQRPEYLMQITELDHAGHVKRTAIRQGGIFKLRDLRKNQQPPQPAPQPKTHFEIKRMRRTGSL